MRYCRGPFSGGQREDVATIWYHNLLISDATVPSMQQHRLPSHWWNSAAKATSGTLTSSRLSVGHVPCINAGLAFTFVESVCASPSDVADRGAFLADLLAGPNNGLCISTGAELGHIRGGETEARPRMAEWLLDEGRAVTSSEPKSSPISLCPQRPRHRRPSSLAVFLCVNCTGG